MIQKFCGLLIVIFGLSAFANSAHAAFDLASCQNEEITIKAAIYLVLSYVSGGDGDLTGDAVVDAEMKAYVDANFTESEEKQLKNMAENETLLKAMLSKGNELWEGGLRGDAFLTEFARFYLTASNNLCTP